MCVNKNKSEHNQVRVITAVYGWVYIVLSWIKGVSEPGVGGARL